ncbi:hypothetical protein WJX75_009410 [Coccomyxa subellipsoidea]|uniref:N-acetyltransferase domain-containing protein n=1 Tax=Coccomyxa subellipsoidea TaxID=248742 RepID=A0ABR2YWW4_9CHLO
MVCASTAVAESPAQSFASTYNNIGRTGNDTAGLQITLTSDAEQVKASQVCALWNAAALDPRDEGRMELALTNSFAVAAAFAPCEATPDARPCRLSYGTIDPSAQQMIAFARVISDGAFAALLIDVVVHPAFRMHGVGKGLVTLLMKNCIRKGASGCVVFAPRERMFFWKCGFRWSNRYRVMSLPEKLQSPDSDAELKSSAA